MNDKVKIKLAKYSTKTNARGRSFITEILWYILQILFFSNFLPGSLHRVLLLKIFGAKIGKNVTIKPYVKVKFPWKLQIGSNTWIGEEVWIENYEHVKIGNNCCISQGAFMCSGMHNFKKENFELIDCDPTIIEDSCWIAAKAKIPPNSFIKEGTFVKMGAIYKNEKE